MKCGRVRDYIITAIAILVLEEILFNLLPLDQIINKFKIVFFAFKVSVDISMLALIVRNHGKIYAGLEKSM